MIEIWVYYNDRITILLVYSRVILFYIFREFHFFAGFFSNVHIKKLNEIECYDSMRNSTYVCTDCREREPGEATF